MQINAIRVFKRRAEFVDQVLRAILSKVAFDDSNCAGICDRGPFLLSMSIFFDGGIGSKIDGFVQGANGSRFRSQCDT
jgi:hypothetical protein